MKLISLAVAAVALVAFSAPASAVFIPIGAPVIVAPVPGTPGTPEKYTPNSKTRGNPGNAYTIATFCPAKAAPGTCTGESLSELSSGGTVTPATAGTPGTPGSCTQPGINVTRGGISAASRPC